MMPSHSMTCDLRELLENPKKVIQLLVHVYMYICS